MQSLEDELLCRVLVTAQVDVEKRAVEAYVEAGHCAVLVGCGLEGQGRVLLERHMLTIAQRGP